MTKRNYEPKPLFLERMKLLLPDKKDFDSYMEGVDDVNVELLETLTVPLKINWASIDPEWMEYLLTECGLELRDESIYGYKYWHTLKIVKITKKDT